jgi:hypothetical protein
MRVGSSSWSLEVSQDWRVTDHPECLTLEPSDQGALQVSAAHKKVGLVTDEDLLSFEEGRMLGVIGSQRRAATSPVSSMSTGTVKKSGNVGS